MPGKFKKGVVELQKRDIVKINSDVKPLRKGKKGAKSKSMGGKGMKGKKAGKKHEK